MGEYQTQDLGRSRRRQSRRSGRPREARQVRGRAARRPRRDSRRSPHSNPCAESPPRDFRCVRDRRARRFRDAAAVLALAVGTTVRERQRRAGGGGADQHRDYVRRGAIRTRIKTSGGNALLLRRGTGGRWSAVCGEPSGRIGEESALAEGAAESCRFERQQRSQAHSLTPSRRRHHACQSSPHRHRARAHPLAGRRPRCRDAAERVRAQSSDDAQRRSPFHFSIGAGQGSVGVTCDGCEFDLPIASTAPSGWCASGGGVGDHLVLAAREGWVDQERSPLANAHRCRERRRPALSESRRPVSASREESAHVGVFENDGGYVASNGIAPQAGLGFDIPMGGTISITP